MEEKKDKLTDSDLDNVAGGVVYVDPRSRPACGGDLHSILGALNNAISDGTISQADRENFQIARAALENVVYKHNV